MHCGVSSALVGLLVFASVTVASAEMRQCSEHRIEYLIGGVGKTGPGGRTCSASTAATPEPRNPAAPTGGRVMKPDDEGRREILQQELEKTRASFLELDKNPVLIPGAGTLAEQRARKMADITSLQAELGRLKP